MAEKVLVAIIVAALGALWFAVWSSSWSSVWQWLNAPVAVPRISVWAVLLVSGCLALAVALSWRTPNFLQARSTSPKLPAEPGCSDAEEKIMRFLATRHESSQQTPVSAITKALGLPKIEVAGALAGLRSRNWAWEQQNLGTVELSEVGMQVSVQHNWHLKPEDVFGKFSLQKEHKKILQLLHTRFPKGTTTEQVEEHLKDTRASTEMKLDELVEMRLVVHVEPFGYGDVGSPHWKLTKEGRNYGVKKGYDLIG